MKAGILPKYEVTERNLVISFPLEQIANYAEADDFSPVQIIDPVAFARYLAGYLPSPRQRDTNIREAIETAVCDVLEDAVYMGAGIRSRLDDIPHLIDRMWLDHSKILTIWENVPPRTTVHDCLVFAIGAASEKKLSDSAFWLEVGQDSSERIAKVLQENIDEAMTYAVLTYGSM